MIIFSVAVNAQDINKLSFKELEDSLSILTKKIASDKSFSIKEDLNTTFENLFHFTLDRKGSMDYPFDSLNHIGKLVSKDGRVRVFTWDIPQSGGYYRYYGIIQVRTGKKTSKLYELKDNRKEIKDAVNEVLDIQNWMGALYYSIVDVSKNGSNYYVLLGFDFNNYFTSKKIIEVLSFDQDNKPFFGSQVFKVGSSTLSRIVFEYSARATLMLHYNEDSKTIVFDHLSPSRPDFAGNFQFYGPDFSYDGFKLEKGLWEYAQDLDLKNPRRERGKPIDTIQKMPEPGFLYKSKGGIPMKTAK
jgi:hypothetical protein